MTAFIASLVGSKIGRFLAGFFLIAAGIGIALLKAIAFGKAQERAKQTQQSLKNIRERVKTDETIRKMPIDDVRRELSSDWLRDN